MGARTGCRRVSSARQVRGASGARANVRRRGAPSALEPGPGPLSSVGRASSFILVRGPRTTNQRCFFFRKRPQLPNLRCGLVGGSAAHAEAQACRAARARGSGRTRVPPGLRRVGWPCAVSVLCSRGSAPLSRPDSTAWRRRSRSRRAAWVRAGACACARGARALPPLAAYLCACARASAR